jgi:hypothetical protein
MFDIVGPRHIVIIKESHVLGTNFGHHAVAFGAYVDGGVVVNVHSYTSIIVKYLKFKMAL